MVYNDKIKSLITVIFVRKIDTPEAMSETLLRK